MSSPSAGYEAASRRAEEAAKQVEAQKAQESAARRLAYERASRRVERLENPEERIIQEQMQRAKETPGAQSSTITINRETGEVRGVETTRAIRSGVPEIQRPVYESPQLEQYFGSQKVGDVLRKQAARAERGESSLYSGRTIYDTEAVRSFMGEYGKEYQGPTEEQGIGYISPRVGFRPSGVEERRDGQILSAPIPRPTYRSVISGESPRFVEIPETDTFTEGAVNVFRNVYEFGASGAGLLRRSEYKPEAEASAYQAVGNVFARAFQGKPAVYQEFMAAKEFGELGQAVQARPSYFAGSLTASGALWAASFIVPPLAAEKLSPFFRQAPEALRGLFGRGRGITPIEERPFAIRPRPQYEYKPIEPYDPFGTKWYTRDIFAARRTERQQAFLKEIERAEEYREPLGSRFAPKDITLYKPFEPPGEGFGGTVKTIYETKTPLVEKTVTKAEELAAEIEKDMARIRESDIAEKAVRDLEKATQRAEKLTREEPLLRPVGETTTGGFSGYAARQISRRTVPLGLGGLTGAERMRRVPIRYEDYYQYVAYPPGYKPMVDLGIFSNQYGQILNVGQTMGADYARFLGLSTAPSLRTTPISTSQLDLGLAALTTPMTISLTTPLLSPLEATVTAQQTRTIQRTRLLEIPRLEMPTVTPPEFRPIETPTPKPEPPIPPFGFELPVGAYGKRRKRKGFTSSLYYTERLWRVPNIFNVNVANLNKLFGLGPTKRKSRK